MPASFVANLFYEFALAGVNKSIPGNGGEECANVSETYCDSIERPVSVPSTLAENR
jgi:hypothetical protein